MKDFKDISLPKRGEQLHHVFQDLCFFSIPLFVHETGTDLFSRILLWGSAYLGPSPSASVTVKCRKMEWILWLKTKDMMRPKQGGVLAKKVICPGFPEL